MPTKSVTIYTTPSCVYCKMAKEFFRAHGVSYKEIDLIEDEKAQEEMIQKSGQLGVPVIDVGGDIVVGFDERRLRKLLEIK